MSVRQRIDIVVTGHVDHGKSTVIGRLLADAGTLPDGKLEQIKEFCRQNSRPFEYAFLLDALKDERSQGITIDSARCFFKTKKRDYIIIDAPGHVEFLKNMISGASRADAAVLVIDAHEGIRENSRRHGYMLSLLGIEQLVVLVNKMDLVNYDLGVFERIKTLYSAFLAELNVKPADFVPVSARGGENIVTRAPWYKGLTLIEHLEAFQAGKSLEKKPFRFPVQDIYKFTEEGDDRRIIAGTAESGTLTERDEIIFFPSEKKSRVNKIESFGSANPHRISAGEATGFTLDEELYVRPGEVMCKKGENRPHVSRRFKANVFWMGGTPLSTARRYKLKIGTARVSVRLTEILYVMDASDLQSMKKKQEVMRHEVASCIIETTKPIAFDLISENQATGRFVLVDRYEISGGGIILEAMEDKGTLWQDHVRLREIVWEQGAVNPLTRERAFGHKARFILITAENREAASQVACSLEKRLFEEKRMAYYLGMTTISAGLGSDINDPFEEREERVRRLGELSRLFTDSGQIFISVLTDLDTFDFETLKLLNAPNELVVIQIGDVLEKDAGADVTVPLAATQEEAVDAIMNCLREKDILPDYCI